MEREVPLHSLYPINGGKTIRKRNRPGKVLENVVADNLFSVSQALALQSGGAGALAGGACLPQIKAGSDHFLFAFSSATLTAPASQPANGLSEIG